MFRTIGIQDPKRFTYDHFALQALLLRQPTQYHRGYLNWQRAFPILLKTVPKSLVDKMFQALKELEKPTPSLTYAWRLQWMSDMSLMQIFAREDHRCKSYHNRNMAQTLTKSVRNYLMVDTRLRTDATEEDIWACVETPKGMPSDLQEA